MIGNNSAGAHSILYGRTVEHLRSLDCALTNGTRVTPDDRAAEARTWWGTPPAAGSSGRCVRSQASAHDAGWIEANRLRSAGVGHASHNGRVTGPRRDRALLAVRCAQAAPLCLNWPTSAGNPGRRFCQRPICAAIATALHAPSGNGSIARRILR
jgi:hypothetical protein